VASSERWCRGGPARPGLVRGVKAELEQGGGKLALVIDRLFACISSCTCGPGGVQSCKCHVTNT
jgi:hypothetical protein